MSQASQASQALGHPHCRTGRMATRMPRPRPALPRLPPRRARMPTAMAMRPLAARAAARAARRASAQGHLTSRQAPAVTWARARASWARLSWSRPRGARAVAAAAQPGGVGLLPHQRGCVVLERVSEEYSPVTPLVVPRCRCGRSAWGVVTLFWPVVVCIGVQGVHCTGRAREGV